MDDTKYLAAREAISLAQRISGKSARQTASHLGMTPTSYGHFCRGLAQVDRLAIIARALGFRLVLTNGAFCLEINPAQNPADTDGRTRFAKDTAASGAVKTAALEKAIAATKAKKAASKDKEEKERSKSLC